MNIIVFFRIISIIVALVGTASLLPVGVAVACNEYTVIPAFVIPMIAAWGAAFILYITARKVKIKLSSRSVFFVVAGAWVGMCLFGAVPLLLSHSLDHITDAVFESVSGFTTTGATIYSDVQDLPRSINLWRCEMHWLGGMGIIALTIALLPLLGVGGFQLIKAESTGPEKTKVTPKIATTAEMLWIIYMFFTIFQTILLMVNGMDFIDGLSISFATLGTGGFAPKNASIAAYQSVPIEIICTVFMFLSGINFSLYYYLITGKIKEVRSNSELKAYAAIFIIAILIVSVVLIPFYGTFTDALRYSSFQVASIMTTTGFATADYTLWPAGAQCILFFLFFIGGCSGSTAGGFKVVRWVVLGKQAHNEMLRMLHPHGIFSIRLDNRAGRKDLVFGVASFVFIYTLVTIITSIIGSLCGLDVLTAFTASLSMIGNVGPAFGSLGPAANYGFIPDLLKWVYCFAMIAGRLELYNLILFFLPDYWEK
jgi:trk system potassium uptake protein